MSPNQYAAHIGVTGTRVFQWMKEGRLPYHTVTINGHIHHVIQPDTPRPQPKPHPLHKKNRTKEK